VALKGDLRWFLRTDDSPCGRSVAKSMIPTSTPPDSPVEFGSFTLLRSQKLLLETGKPVRIGNRALDILIALVDRAGEVVSKEELNAFVWPRAVVEENSLRVQVAALRKVLGDGQLGARFIINLAGRGYCFVAPLSRVTTSVGPIVPPDVGRARLPTRLTRMLGRTDEVEALVMQMPLRRLVTIVGAGGVGKTTIAVAVAERLLSAYRDGVFFVDLAQASSGPLVSNAIASAVGLNNFVGSVDAAMIDFFRDKQLLLVFDNCEHVVKVVAGLIEPMLQAASGINILATSREPLRAEGEWLHRLQSLQFPPQREDWRSDEVVKYPAVQLFVERATASLDTFDLTDRDAPLVADLCARLGGNALAIELAAARVEPFGIRGLVAQLDAHLLRLKHPRRTALPRHQTLTTMLDWSYQLLSPQEQTILRRLAIFHRAFTLDAAQAIANPEGGGGVSEADLWDGIAELNSKSLMISDVTEETVLYRLPEVTRVYAFDMLSRGSEFNAISRCHALYLLRLFRESTDAWMLLSKSEWRVRYAWGIDDVRSALHWAFSPNGDPTLGAELTVIAWSLSWPLNPFDEPDTLQRALRVVEATPVRNTELELRLNMGLASMLMQQRGWASGVSEPAWRALEIAENSGNRAWESEARIGITICLMIAGEYNESTVHAERLSVVARESRDAVAMVVADRIGAQVWHFAGDHGRARKLAERVLGHPIPRGAIKNIGGFVDHRVSMRIVLSRIQFLEGYADAAMRLAEEAVELAETDSGMSLTQALAFAACPIALWRGDLDLAAAYIQRLDVETRKNHFRRSSIVSAEDYGSVLHYRKTGGLVPVVAPSGSQERDFVISVHEPAVDAAAVLRAEVDKAGWCTAEILRIHGDCLVFSNLDEAARAQALYEKSLRAAREQGALAFELRTAMSIARLRIRQRRAPEGLDLLAQVQRRFTEGHSTADLVKAAALLAGAAPPSP
jgi:predicted ATPase/DNA-binding winged helix-turn-helix (wHTH) protein